LNLVINLARPTIYRFVLILTKSESGKSRSKYRLAYGLIVLTRRERGGGSSSPKSPDYFF
jgi:hypothetical protein